MMIRTALLSGLVSMALFLPEGMAADPPKAQVVSKKHISGQPKCSQHMEAMIRRHGYRMVDSSFPAGQVALKVETWSDCRLTRVERNYVCNARASVSRGGVSSGSTCGSRFNAEGMSISGWGAALDEACRKLTQQIENTLGHVGAKSLPTEPQQVPVSKTSHLELLVTWEGELDPMPLLPLTRFFTKSGFEAGLAQSGEGSYLYALDLTDPPEHFQFQLQTFLEHHYQVNCGFVEGGRLACRLVSLRKEIVMDPDGQPAPAEQEASGTAAIQVGVDGGQQSNPAD